MNYSTSLSITGSNGVTKLCRSSEPVASSSNVCVGDWKDEIHLEGSQENDPEGSFNVLLQLLFPITRISACVLVKELGLWKRQYTEFYRQTISTPQGISNHQRQRAVITLQEQLLLRAVRETFGETFEKRLQNSIFPTTKPFCQLRTRSSTVLFKMLFWRLHELSMLRCGYRCTASGDGKRAASKINGAFSAAGQPGGRFRPGDRQRVPRGAPRD